MRKFASLRVTLTLLCALYTSLSFAQEKRISGTVTDDKQTPLSGATISVKGTRAFTTTDATGRFTITVPQNGRTLVVSYVSMQPQEIAIGNTASFSVSLIPA